jgi:hypothetical protein
MSDEFIISAYTSSRRPSVTIERREQRDGTILWAVHENSFCLARDGLWEYEPLPSSRDDKFLKRCRYATLEEAMDEATKAIDLLEEEERQVREVRAKAKKE